MSTAASGRIRARDIDRAAASSLLDAAYAEGQLGADEYHDRIAQAAAARTLGELTRLTADLQTPAGAGEFAADRPPITRKMLRRPASGTSYPGHTRARDADRATTRELLDLARADGQLSEEEHETLTELAAQARTLGDLEDLVADLQRPGDVAPPPRPPRSRRRQWYLGAVTVAAVTAACAGFLAVTRAADEPRAATEAVSVTDLGAVQPLVVPTPSLLTTDGITTFLRNYQRKFGDLQVDELRMYDEYASLVRAVPGQPSRKVEYYYRGGFAQSREIETRKADTPSVDLGGLNAEAVGRALADAATITRVPGGVISHFAVGVNDDRVSAESGKQPVVEVYVSNSVRESGHFMMTPAGEVRRVWPFKG
ncbi:DUF1707 SHOCT-like domain-containing protein [Nocardia pneumoniae]|uniref:DUF1707 SHOCT-like domain-containing protein n=1 Tax=Nocardia pneumoniae TaxID=228601 RepID=UPI00031404D7|nr:DUF1707 domain-containing protein [Nocardia pneumoniae]